MAVKRFVTKELIMDVKILVEFATIYRPSGVQSPKKDWEMGVDKMRSQNPDLYKKLFKKEGWELKQLKAVWAKYQNVAYGYCAKLKCAHKLEADDMFYCKECAPRSYERLKPNVKKKTLLEHKEKVLVAVGSMQEEFARRLVYKYITKMTEEDKLAILGKEFPYGKEDVKE